MSRGTVTAVEKKAPLGVTERGPSFVSDGLRCTHHGALPAKYYEEEGDLCIPKARGSHYAVKLPGLGDEVKPPPELRPCIPRPAARAYRALRFLRIRR